MDCAKHSLDMFGCAISSLSVLLVVVSLGTALYHLREWFKDRT